MPQMSPILWLMIFLYVVILIFLFKVLVFYLYKYLLVKDLFSLDTNKMGMNNFCFMKFDNLMYKFLW